MPKLSTKSDAPIAANRPSRRCQAVASELTPKLCVACKLGGLKEKDVFTCRETMGHVAPNWDAPNAAKFFSDATVTPEEARAWQHVDAAPSSSPAGKKKKRKASPKPAKKAASRGAGGGGGA